MPGKPPSNSQLAFVEQLRAEIDGIAHALDPDAPGMSTEGLRETLASGNQAYETQDAAGVPVGGQVSYSLWPMGQSMEAMAHRIDPDGAIAELLATVQSTLAQLSLTATIQSARDGMAAKTVIRYSGFTATVWGSEVSPELIREHLARLQHAYELRAAFAGVIAAVGGAIVGISLAVANPLTALSAVSSAKSLKIALDRMAAAIQTANLGAN